MQFETSQSSCPLCRRTLSDNVVGLAPDSRLCDECRGIVKEAFPGPSSRVSVSMAASQTDGKMPLVQQGGPLLDLPWIESSEFIDGGSSVDSFQREAEFSSPALLELDDDWKSDPRGGEKSAGEYSVKAETADMSEDGSSQARTGRSNQNAETGPEYTEHPLAGEREFHSPEQAAAFTEPVATDLIVDHIDGPQSSEQAGVTDPWEDPLPAWDHSRSEWPILMGPPPRRDKFGALRASLVALLLLAGGGFYFFILQPTIREQRTIVPVGPKRAERATAAAEPNVPEAMPAEPVPHSVASTPAPEPPAIVDPKPAQVPEDGNTRGTFSLQAAAFPTQAGADEFGEKLRKAGVPSYIVSADLGRRGRWFRVRVGRFNSADEAQKFAAESQLRAKAAGISLQLIGCQYDQP